MLEEELMEREREKLHLSRLQKPFKFKVGDYVRATIAASFFTKHLKVIIQKKYFA